MHEKKENVFYYITAMNENYSHPEKPKGCDDGILKGMYLFKEGKNKGKGVDSYSRYIYIHGTHEEGLIGEKASHGCIRMLNNDVIDLYNYVNIGTEVYISV